MKTTRRIRSRKPSNLRAARTTVSMPLLMFVKATEQQEKRGLNHFSAYIQYLVHQDISAGPLKQQELPL